jgi:two-component system chemotaxis response regulator CheB
VSGAFEQALAGRAIDALVIGGSAGGIGALLKILPALPERFSFPVVIVLHLPDDGDSRLAAVFAQHLRMPVRQAQDKAFAQAGVVYFASAGYHLSIEPDHSFSLSTEEPVHFSRPAIDLLMESAADAYGKRLAGILLTGAKAGGLTVAQDPDEAEMRTMPQAAITLGAAELVLRLDHIHELLLELGTL